MKYARVRGKEWAYRLYVLPESAIERAALWLRGYRKCPWIIFTDRLMVHDKHKNNTDLLK